MGKSTTVIKTLEHFVYILHKVTKMILLDTTILKILILSQLLQNARIVNLICVF